MLSVISKQTNEGRIDWIDIARGIGIATIVFGHMSTHGFLRQYVFSFHVPFFFLLAGLSFTYTNNYKKFILKKIRTIVVPYFLFSMISILILFIIGNFVANISDKANINVFDNIWVMIFGNSKPESMKYNLPLWFLACFFVVVTLSYGIERLINNNKHSSGLRIIVMFLFASVGAVLSPICENIILPWHIETAVSMTVFYLLGIELRKFIFDHSIEKVIQIKTTKLLFLSFAVLILGGFLCFFNRTIGVRNDHYGNIFIYYISALSGCFGWLVISIIIGKNKLLQYLGRNTLPILVTHKFPILFFQTIFPLTKNHLSELDTVSGVFTALIVTIVAILMCLIAGEIIRYICPWAIGEKRKK